ncbi:MAG TPA: hypothetical protein VI322_04850 [Candidatus Saccharimonadia bacterium]
MASTLLTAPPVTGLVQYFDADKRFGFAAVTQTDRGPRQVFFHVRNGRQVIGNYFQPTLTSCPAQYRIPDPRRTRPGTELVMVIESGEDRRDQAVAWGIRPRRTWYDTMLNERTLTQYLGGLVRISEQRPGQPYRWILAGRLNRALLTREEFALHGQQFDSLQYVGFNTRPAGQAFELGFSTQGSSQRRSDHCLALEFPLEDGGMRYVWLTPAPKTAPR